MRSRTAVVATACRSTCCYTSLVIPSRFAIAFTVPCAPRLDRERLRHREMVLQKRTHAVRGRHHTDLGLLAAGPPFLLIRSWRYSHRTSFGVSSQRSPTRSPLASKVLTTSRLVGVSRALERRSDSSGVSGSLTFDTETPIPWNCATLGIERRNRGRPRVSRSGEGKINGWSTPVRV